MAPLKQGGVNSGIYNSEYNAIQVNEVQRSAVEFNAVPYLARLYTGLVTAVTWLAPTAQASQAVQVQVRYYTLLQYST